MMDLSAKLKISCNAANACEKNVADLLLRINRNEFLLK